jgi:hypothetical protein
VEHKVDFVLLEHCVDVFVPYMGMFVCEFVCVCMCVFMCVWVGICMCV